MTIVSSSEESQCDSFSSMVSKFEPAVVISACAHARNVGENEGKLMLGDKVGMRSSEGDFEGEREGEVDGCLNMVGPKVGSGLGQLEGAVEGGLDGTREGRVEGR